MSELSPEGRSLLEAARAARPSAAARARIDAGLAVRIGSAPPGTPPSPPAPAAAPGAAAVGPVAKVVAIGAMIGVVGAGAAALWGRAPAQSAETHAAEPHAGGPAPPAASVEPPAPVVEAPPPAAVVSSLPAQPSRDRSAPRARRPATAGSEAPPAASGSAALGEELSLLREAQQALKQGDGARALSALDELAARHPDGELREERLAAYVLGLCAAGRAGEAREAGRRFLAEMPASVQAERVRASCAFVTRSAREP